MKKKSIPASYHNHTWHGDSKRHIDSTNPTNDDCLGSFSLCEEKKMLDMISHAKQTQIIWRNIPAPKRGELIRKIGLSFREHKENLLTAVKGTTIKEFRLPPVSMKGRPVVINMDIDDENVSLKTTHNNEKIYFNERELNDLVFLRSFHRLLQV